MVDSGDRFLAFCWDFFGKRHTSVVEWHGDGQVNYPYPLLLAN
jgi:hypothetical protein